MCSSCDENILLNNGWSKTSLKGGSKNHPRPMGSKLLIHVVKLKLQNLQISTKSQISKEASNK